MSFHKLKTTFTKGDVSKPDYISRAYFDFHAQLYDYVQSLRLTDIREISITSNGVIFTVRSTGVRFYGQPGDHRCPPIETLNFSDFEPDESHMMRKLFDGCTVFYDIGANIGWHSLNLASTFRDAKFICFEPIPSTYQQLLANLNLNGFTTILTFNLALSNRDSSQRYFYYDSCSGNASAVNLTQREDVREIECQEVRLDTFVKSQSLPQPDFIKCDVEGAELNVLKGALDVIRSERPIIMAEILRKWSAKYQYDPNEIFQLLSSIGYSAFTTDGKILLPFNRMTDETIETNFFFLHPEIHSEKLRQFAKF